MIQGIDVSHWQGLIDWTKVDRDFAYIKATESTNYKDDKFALNWQGARDNGIKVGAYHFWRFATDPVKQAEYFFDYVTQHGYPGDLPPALDLEDTYAPKSNATPAAFSKALVRIEELFGRKPIIYTAQWWWNPWTLSNKNFSNYDLWVAFYGYKIFLPRYIPAGWTKQAIWQKSAKGSVPGVAGDCDLDEAEDDWYAKVAPSPPQTPSAPYEVSLDIPKEADSIVLTLNRG